MIKRLLLLAVIVIVFAGCGKSVPFDKTEILLDYNNPTVYKVPDTSNDMYTSGYWISKHSTPDDLIMTDSQIQELNSRTAQEHYIVRVSEYGEAKEAEFISSSIKTLFNATNSEFYFDDGSKVKEADLATLYHNLNLDKLERVESVVMRYGVVSSRVSQKVIPTNRYLLRAGNGYFDRMQMSSLDIGTPVAILWQSNDAKWFYVRSPLTVGWVPITSVALTSVEDIPLWESDEKFVVFTSYKSSIYSDADLTKYASWAPLGAKLPLALQASQVDATSEYLSGADIYKTTANDADAYKGNGRDVNNFHSSRNDVIAVLMPMRQASNAELIPSVKYVKRVDINIGHVEYTVRNMLDLSFKLLHSPYGWGGMNGDQDCSGLMLQLFNSVGIILPRNSGLQGQVGEAVYDPNFVGELTPEILIKYKAIPGATLMHMPGHIMLYVGTEGDDPYVIHSIWSYEELRKDVRVLKQPARVIVSNLNLSKHSTRGRYLDRLKNIKVIKVPDVK